MCPSEGRYSRLKAPRMLDPLFVESLIVRILHKVDMTNCTQKVPVLLKCQEPRLAEKDLLHSKEEHTSKNYSILR